MFWILKKSRITSGAVSLFNNNPLSSINNGYNKLGCTDETDKNGNAPMAASALMGRKEDLIPDNLCRTPDIDSDTSSFSDLDPDDFSQDSDYEENLTCNVCDRFFFSQNQLIQHQHKKRHFGCWSCDSLFPTLMALEHHKEEMDHWSGDERPGHNHSDDSDSRSVTHELDRLL